MKIDGLHVTGGRGISLGDDVYGDIGSIQIGHAIIEDAKQGFTFNQRGAKGGRLHDIRVRDTCLQEVKQPLTVDQDSGAGSNQLSPDSSIAFERVAIAGQGTLEPSGMKQDGAASYATSSAAIAGSTMPAWELDVKAVSKSGNKSGARAKLVVAQDGSGDFRSVEEAVEALPVTGGEIEVKPGSYREVVTIRKPHVHLHGEDSDPAKTVLAFDNTGPKSGGTFNSATLFVEADDVSVDQITIANDAGSGKGQAVALAVTADRADFRELRLLGAQDTLYAASKYCYGDYGPCVPARQYFEDCYIDGNVDFIFGDSKAFFNHCEIHGIAGKNVMYTTLRRASSMRRSAAATCLTTAD